MDFGEIVLHQARYSSPHDGGHHTARPWTYWRAVGVLHYVVLSEIPKAHAFAAVAPGVRFSFLAILATPALCFASALRVRTSSFVQSRRTAAFFLGKSSLLIC